MQTIPAQPEFFHLARKGTLVPVYRQLIADTETPVSAFLKIDAGDYAFLLESVEGGEQLGRYSFLGSEPSLVVSSLGTRLTVRERQKNNYRIVTDADVADPLAELQRLFGENHFVALPDLPRFCGGFVGYLGYDMVRFFERLPKKNPARPDFPEMLFLRVDTLLIFDHVKHVIKIVSVVDVRGKQQDRAALRQAYAAAEERIAGIQVQLRRHASPPPKHKPPRAAAFRREVTQAEFEQRVRRAKAYIRAGDIIQTVLSQRLSASIAVPPFAIYRALRMVNPSPYMFYITTPDITAVGASPEIMVRCEQGNAQVRPIAGTRPRGRSEQDDERLTRQLLADPKERAEHIMLVDLGRNDLGRVCRPGSVQVRELLAVEKYSHVMHLVSDISGRLAAGKTIFDLIRATFPAGTVSGAPKIRAMEIIDELESVRRGPYAGCVCYFSFSGNLDSCITIRTLLVKERVAYVQAGAGIVAESRPAREYQETLNKAKALMRAVALAHEAALW